MVNLASLTSRELANYKAEQANIKRNKASKKKNKGKDKKKLLKMDRESVEKRRMAKLEKIRLKLKKEKLQKSIDKENKILNQTKYRSERDKLEKIQMFGKRKKEGDGITEMGLHPRTGKVIDKEQADILREVDKLLGLKKGGMMKKMGYMYGGSAMKKSKTGYGKGGMTKSKKK